MIAVPSKMAGWDTIEFPDTPVVANKAVLEGMTVARDTAATRDTVGLALVGLKEAATVQGRHRVSTANSALPACPHQGWCRGHCSSDW